ncbi:hypothetical protein BpHYR1_013728 [Brachionus plicatilis]|uniref:Uncharacterized protein n=1 Tax=Brachionus plicatilis TaxID=10195 RepID=A0A3M7PB36_BRAPC|nr:hypothetical protein BpHYR1_013728 [Brachionus plicatilis]
MSQNDNPLYSSSSQSNPIFYETKYIFFAKISHDVKDITLLICIYSESAQSHLQNGVFDILAKNGKKTGVFDHADHEYELCFGQKSVGWAWHSIFGVEYSDEKFDMAKLWASVQLTSVVYSRLMMMMMTL